MWSYAWADEKFELLWGSRPIGSISAAATRVPPRFGVWAEISRARERSRPARPPLTARLPPRNARRLIPECERQESRAIEDPPRECLPRAEDEARVPGHPVDRRRRPPRL